MAEVKPSTSGGEVAIEIVGEPRAVERMGPLPPSPCLQQLVQSLVRFFTWMWIRIWTACSGVCGARRRGLPGPRRSGLASGALQHSLEDSKSEVLSRIAASKSTWSEVPGRDIHNSVAVSRPSELAVWEELKASAPLFFHEYSAAELELGSLIAEGGQAQIFEAKGYFVDCVWKVFKLDAGFSLADLKRHWPRCMRKDGEDCSEIRSMQDRSFGFVFEDFKSNVDGERCIIVGATLFKDGRFAFLMRRYWGDLRTLLDLKVKGNIHPLKFCMLPRTKKTQSPFSFSDSRWIMLQIARGMQGLHAQGVLHKDLKAANVLIQAGEVETLFCDVADYECAMFVQGTGFWRAPEVLQELLKKEGDRNGGIWTKKVDVYSYGMTCYEILTGHIPFDGWTRSKWDDVIKGERPFLPNYVDPQFQELVEACWHAQPSQRPSFDDIVEKIDELRSGCKVFFWES